MQTPHPFTKILLPFDGSPSARMAVRFAAAMAPGKGGAERHLTLLYVAGGSYLARHLQNVDLRVVRLERTAEWQRIREHRLEREIRPLLAEGKDILVRSGFQGVIEVQIEEGKIGERIMHVAQQGEYTAIIMGRRGLSPFKELILGSVTQYTLAHAQGLTVFIVGQGYEKPSESPLFPLLLPVDGSEPSLEAVRQAVQIVQGWRQSPGPIEIMNVVDLALLGQMLTDEAQVLIDEGSRALGAAQEILAQAGLKTVVEEKLVSGIPPQVIVQEITAKRCPLVLMGSVGHAVLSRLLLGSVTHSVLHLAPQPTIGVVYPKLASVPPETGLARHNDQKKASPNPR